MSGKGKKLSVKYVAEFVLGVGFFVVGTVTALVKSSKPEKSAEKPARKPAKKKSIPVIERPAVPKAAEFFLKLEAKPKKFVRRKAGTIKAKTLPGASCTIDAVYSTRRRPTKLDTTSVVAGHDGLLEWSWAMGTGGSHVDVTVTATLEGHDDIVETLHVAVVD